MAHPKLIVTKVPSWQDARAAAEKFGADIVSFTVQCRDAATTPLPGSISPNQAINWLQRTSLDTDVELHFPGSASYTEDSQDAGTIVRLLESLPTKPRYVRIGNRMSPTAAVQIFRAAEGMDIEVIHEIEARGRTSIALLTSFSPIVSLKPRNGAVIDWPALREKLSRDGKQLAIGGFWYEDLSSVIMANPDFLEVPFSEAGTVQALVEKKSA